MSLDQALMHRRVKPPQQRQVGCNGRLCHSHQRLGYSHDDWARFLFVFADNRPLGERLADKVRFSVTGFPKPAFFVAFCGVSEERSQRFRRELCLCAGCRLQNAMKRKGAYATLQAIIEAGGDDAAAAISEHGRLTMHLMAVFVCAD